MFLQTATNQEDEMTEIQTRAADTAAQHLLFIIAKDIRDGRDPQEAFQVYCTKFATEYPELAAAVLQRIAG
jgi:hypothetical protein